MIKFNYMNALVGITKMELTHYLISLARRPQTSAIPLAEKMKANATPKSYAFKLNPVSFPSAAFSTRNHNPAHDTLQAVGGGSGGDFPF